MGVVTSSLARIRALLGAQQQAESRLRRPVSSCSSACQTLPCLSAQQEGIPTLQVTYVESVSELFEAFASPTPPDGIMRIMEGPMGLPANSGCVPAIAPTYVAFMPAASFSCSGADSRVLQSSRLCLRCWLRAAFSGEVGAAPGLLQTLDR